MAKYLLRITASDGKFQASVPVEVFVLDINDNSPQCSQVRDVEISKVARGAGERRTQGAIFEAVQSLTLFALAGHGTRIIVSNCSALQRDTPNSSAITVHTFSSPTLPNTCPLFCKILLEVK